MLLCSHIEYYVNTMITTMDIDSEYLPHIILDLYGKYSMGSDD